MTIIVRYLKDDIIVEIFITFVEIHSHTDLDLTNVLFKFFKKNVINIKNCRDKAMITPVTCLEDIMGYKQAHIKNHNLLAMWIPCAAHSLNLVGQHAVESSTTVSSYVASIQRLYTFFSTPKRWNVLSSRLKEVGHVVIKRLRGTRWSSHTDAVRALSDGYSIVLDVIIKMKKYNLNALSLIELNYLYKRMNEF